MAETIAQIAVEVGDVQDHNAQTLRRVVLDRRARGLMSEDSKEIFLRRIAEAVPDGVHATTHG